MQYSRNWCNKPPVVRIAQAMLKGLRQTPIPNDKNSGYTLIADSEIRLILFKILESDKYELIDEETLRLRKYRAAGNLTSLVKRLSKAMDDASVANSVQKSSWAAGATEVAQIQ